MKMPFLCLADFSLLPEPLRGAVVAIGNFDGVHRGHQAVLHDALDQAHMCGRPAIVLTFEPHPRTLFRPDIPVSRLTPPEEKAEIFRLMGFDAVIEQAFTREFSVCTPEAFVHDVLYCRLAASVVVTGDNFCFAHRRKGRIAFLQREGKRLGFDVRVISGFRDEGGELVSSSRIRTLLKKGRVEEAAGLLGYHYTISEKVIHGAALGRKLGYPTANMALQEQANVAFGVYAARFRCANGQIYDGMASFGCRPTVHSAADPLLETCLFDFSGDLYSQKCSVSFFAFLRHQKKFSHIDLLVEQMHHDATEARAALAGACPRSLLDRCFTFESWIPAD